MSTGSLKNAGIGGSYWSSSAYEATLNTFSFHTNNTNVFPSTNNDRWPGFTVRIKHHKNTPPNLSIYLTCGGDVNMDTGSSRNAGFVGSSWSGTASQEALYSFHVNVYDTIIGPSYLSSRYLGFTVL